MQEVLLQKTILVVDDEDDVRESVREVLSDEGYRVVDTADGARVLEMIKDERPELVLLDIWMPQVDGIGLLKEIKIQEPNINVVMVSGHGNIHTAVTATKYGAFDFIEKPVSLEGLLTTVQRALGELPLTNEPASSGTAERKAKILRPAVTVLRNKAAVHRVMQKTLQKSVVLSGQGLHSGVKTGLILHPLPPNSGIQFTGISADVTVPAHLDFVGSTGYATSLRSKGFAVGTVEHLLAVLHSYGITNLLVKVQGEVPIMDGSAIEFCQAIEEAGIAEENAELAEIVRSIIFTNSKPRTANRSASSPPKSSRCTTSCDIPHPSVNKNISIITKARRPSGVKSRLRARSVFCATSPSCRPWAWPMAAA